MTVNYQLILFSVSFFIYVSSFQNNYCQLSCDYVVENFTHTVCNRKNETCGPDDQCGPDFRTIEFSDELRQRILELHNEYRNTVASGNEKRGNQPSAANMNILNYNKELEFIAQCWANTCNGNPLIHDHCRRTSDFEHVGQNLGFINSSEANIDIKKSVEELIFLWYDEVAIFDSSWVNDTVDRGPEVIVGHYTQLVWADTAEIGCAASFYTSESFNATWNHLVFVCNYGPGGNYLGLPVYEVGEPCSNCPDDLEPNEKYSGLCGEAKSVNESMFDVFEVL